MNSIRSHAALAAIVDISADAIIALDDGFRIVRFNRGAEQIFGWTEPEMLGQPLDRLLPMAVRAVHRAHMRTFAEGPIDARHMGDRREITGVRRNGEGSFADFFGGSLKRLLVPPRNRDLRAFTCESLGYTEPDPTVAARNDGNFILKIFHCLINFKFDACHFFT